MTTLRPRTRSHHFQAIRSRSPVARATTASIRSGSAPARRGASWPQSTRSASSRRRVALTARRSRNPRKPASRVGRSDALNEPTVPEGEVDESPQRVVVVRATGEMLADERLDTAGIEVGPHDLGPAQQLHHVVAELVPQPLLERQAV